MRYSENLFRARIQIFLQWDTHLLTDGFEFIQVLFVLTLILDLGLDSCSTSCMLANLRNHHPIATRKVCKQVFKPSKIRTAVGKSLTLLAAFNAAVRTDGEGTRSYAKALFKFR